jgi:hypothetical protein
MTVIGWEIEQPSHTDTDYVTNSETNPVAELAGLAKAVKGIETESVPSQELLFDCRQKA